MTNDYRFSSRVFNSVVPFLCILVMHIIGFLILKDQENSWWPQIASYKHLDPGWYNSIVEKGYEFNPDGANNTAFFPLFPYVWRWSHLGDVGISIFNAVIFLISTYFLLQHFSSNWKTRLLFLTTSILVFYVTPFSESIFFCFITLLLIGLNKNKFWWVVIGLIGAGLTRSVCTVFFPAYIIIGLYKYYNTKSMKAAIPYFFYSLISLTTLITVFVIQWYQTGEFFAFSNTQKHWNTGWRMPTIPFTSWPPEDNTYYDQLALFICLISVMTMVYFLIQVLIKKQSLQIKDTLLLSLLYFSGISVIMLCTRGGGFNGINRYVFATPFIYVLIKELESWAFTKAHAAFILLLGAIFYIICWNMGSTPSRILVAATSIALVLITPILIKRDRPVYTITLCLLSAIMLYIQAHLWHRYIVDVWVG